MPDDYGEFSDGYRYLRLSIKSWTYYTGSSKHEQEEINPASVKGIPPFKNTREEWISDETDRLIKKLVYEMIDEFGSRGIIGKPGKNEGSIDWDYEILNATFRWVSKADLDQLKLLEKKLVESEDKLSNLIQLRRGQKETILSFRGVTETEEPDVKKFVAVAKAAVNRFNKSISIQRTVIERQKEAIDLFKFKIGMEVE
jgi:hypothetical protein